MTCFAFPEKTQVLRSLLRTPRCVRVRRQPCSSWQCDASFEKLGRAFREWSGFVLSERKPTLAMLKPQSDVTKNTSRRKNSFSLMEEFVVAATLAPRRYLHRSSEGHIPESSARKDVTEEERSRWIRVLADILRGTETPVAKLLSEPPASSRLAEASVRVVCGLCCVCVLVCACWVCVCGCVWCGVCCGVAR